METTVDKEIWLKSKLELFAGDESQKTEDSEQLVVSRKEQTEDGVEWMPYFGSFYVTVK